MTPPGASARSTRSCWWSRSSLVGAWVLRAGVHARLGRRLRAHGHRRAARARAAPRSERDELAAAALLARGRRDDAGARAHAGRGARGRRGARGASAWRRRTWRCAPSGVAARRRRSSRRGSRMAVPWNAWLGVATVPEGWTGALVAAAVDRDGAARRRGRGARGRCWRRRCRGTRRGRRARSMAGLCACAGSAGTAGAARGRELACAAVGAGGAGWRGWRGTRTRTGARFTSSRG